MKELIKEILAITGESQAWLADQVGVSQANISRILNGQQPSYKVGKTIEELHKQVLTKSFRRSTDKAFTHRPPLKDRRRPLKRTAA